MSRRFANTLLALSLTTSLSSLAQTTDTVRVLDEVAVEAYAADRDPSEVPASIQLLSSESFNRFTPTSLLPAFNMLPGVRMEERSPGSYRFSIRGSLLRSPFGVRNVKFYYNGLPFTDGGGNTYLNLLDLLAIGRAEVIKGPTASLYGAGTGGAVLFRSPRVRGVQVGLNAQYGSFGAFRIGGDIEVQSGPASSRMQYVRQRSDGYRDQSAFERNSFLGDFSFALSASDQLQLTFLQTTLKYETPGGLTEAQYFSNPKQARPSGPSGPGAVEQRAAVANSTFYSGFLFDHTWSKAWQTALGFAVSRTDFRNPAIRNYETREEKNISARLTTVYEGNKTKIVFGGEYQRYSAPILVRNNQGGIPGTTIISQDDIMATQGMGFVQAEMNFSAGWQAVWGASVNYTEYNDERSVPGPPATNHMAFNPEVMPRLALMKKVSSSHKVYLSASRGFSPPTVAELLPSTGIYNPTLHPESGWNYEVGVNGKVGESLEYHLALYDFRLTNAIVLQRDSSGADFYVNAGDTRQQGVEFHSAWTKQLQGLFESLRITTGITYSAFHFGNYVQDGNDYSGNKLTGVPPLVVAFGLDFTLRNGIYFQATGNYTDRIPLNDANTDHAADYFLLGARAGIRIGKIIPMDIYTGVDNALNQRYSLGNDLNAAGQRYYNAAPTANYYIGLSARLPVKP